MILTKTHKTVALIIPFPSEKIRKRGILEATRGKCQILFFTGVRYERIEESGTDLTRDDGRSPRRGGHKPRRTA